MPDFVPPPRKLGDVPGLNDILNPITDDLTLGDDYLADPLALGTFGNPNDPFSMTVARHRTEMMEARSPERAGEGARNPQTGSYLPTLEELSSDPVSYDYDDSGNYSPSYSPTVSIAGLDAEQIANAEVIAKVGKQVGASDRDVQIAIMAALVESNMRNLDYGDRDSIGMFQQRDAWGSFEDRINPYESARMFFLGGAAGQEGLLDKEDREQMGMGEAAQAVQVSAFPDRYAEREAEAAAILSKVAADHRIVKGGYEGKDPYALTDDGHGHTLDNITAAALEKAHKFYGGSLPITQGSHNHGGVAASGGTHDQGGVVDIIVEDGRWEEAVIALRKVGFAAWDRTEDQGPWPRHIHAVLVGHENLAPAAAQQVQSYLNNDNGLVGSTPDDGPRDWVGTVFKWSDVVKDPNESHRRKVVSRTRSLLGTPFEWGGEDEYGMDQGGFVRSVYRELGVNLPKDELEIPWSADPKPIENVELGDMIAWEDGTGTRLGVYLGDDLLASADGPGTVVRVNALSDITEAWALPISSLLNNRQENALSDAADPYVPASSPNYTPSYAPSYSPSSSSIDNSTDTTPQGFGSSYTPAPSGGGGGGKKNDPPGGKTPDFGV